MEDLTTKQREIYRVALELDPGWSINELAGFSHSAPATVRTTLYRLQSMGLAYRREGATARAWRVMEQAGD